MWFARNLAKEKGVSKLVFMKPVEEGIISKMKEVSIAMKTIMKAVERISFIDYKTLKMSMNFNREELMTVFSC